MAGNNLKPGESLNRIVGHLERVLNQENVSIESNVRIRDSVSKSLREHDVLVTITKGHHVVKIAIECRDRSRKVGQNEVEAFIGKCRDTGIDQGIIVSTKGFASGALSKAKIKGIRCLMIDEVQSFDWLLATGIDVIQRVITDIHYRAWTKRNIKASPPEFKIMHKSGAELTSEVMNHNALKLLNLQYPIDPLKITSASPREGTISAQAVGEGWYLDIKDRKNRLWVSYFDIFAAFKTERYLSPFKNVNYVDVENEQEIAKAAVADLNIGNNIRASLVIVDHGEGGRRIHLVSDQKSK